MTDKKIKSWTVVQLVKFLKEHPEARIMIDYPRLKEMYPGIDFPNREQEAALKAVENGGGMINLTNNEELVEIFERECGKPVIFKDGRFWLSYHGHLLDVGRDEIESMIEAALKAVEGGEK